MYPYELKQKYQYNFSSYEELDYLIRKNGWNISLSKNVSILNELKPTINKTNGEIVSLKNPITVHPMEGFDGTLNGAPSALTKRRWLRMANSGASLVWSEAIAVVPEGRTSDHQLWINDDNVDEYAKIINEMKKENDFLFICQLTHSGRMSKNSLIKQPIIMCKNEKYDRVRPYDKDTLPCSDDYLSSLPEKFAHAALLALKAGFDGVDIKACHGYLLGESLGAYNRDGVYGGSFENRTRLLQNITDNVLSSIKSPIILGSRFGISDMIEYPFGFGMKQDGSLSSDFNEPIKILNMMMDKGLSVIDVTMGSPYYNPYVNRPANIASMDLVEHPLVGVERLQNSAYEIKKALPKLKIIGTGYSYFKEQAIYAASGCLIDGKADIIGFGRMAFAYEGFVKDMLNGFMDKNKSCITCGNCTKIMRAGGTTGCPIRDQEVYLPIYKQYIKGK